MFEPLCGPTSSRIIYFTGFALTFAFFRILIWQQGGKNVYLEITGVFVSMMFLVVLVCCRNRRRPGYGEGDVEEGEEQSDDIYDRYYTNSSVNRRVGLPRVGLTKEEIALLPRINHEKRKLVDIEMMGIRDGNNDNGEGTYCHRPNSIGKSGNVIKKMTTLIEEESTLTEPNPIGNYDNCEKVCQYDSELQQPLPVLTSPPRVKPSTSSPSRLQVQQHMNNLLTIDCHPPSSSHIDFPHFSLFGHNAIVPLEFGSNSNSPNSLQGANRSIPSISFGKFATVAVAMRDSGSSVNSQGRHSTTGMPGEERSSMSNCCPICLGDYTSEDVLVLLPCNHDYHEVCISEWLLQHASCPMCKYDLLQDFAPTNPTNADSASDLNSITAGGQPSQSSLMTPLPTMNGIENNTENVCRDILFNDDNNYHETVQETKTGVEICVNENNEDRVYGGDNVLIKDDTIVRNEGRDSLDGIV